MVIPARLSLIACCCVLFGLLSNSHAANSERLGPSSRRTGLVVSEVMYNPAPRPDALNGEYIEIYNSEPFPADLSGFEIKGSAQYQFPAGTVLPPLSFLVVAPAPDDASAIYGLTNVIGGFGAAANSLPNGGGLIQLWSAAGAVLLEVDYTDEHPWPVLADGSGHSMALARPSYGEGFPKAWGASAVIGGSPGRAEPVVSDPLDAIVINEFLANTDAPAVDFIELYNRGPQSVDLSGAVLTDNAASNKFTIPQGTLLASGAAIHFTETQLGFGLSSDGETIYLKNPGQNRFVDALRFGPQETGVPAGRYPNGADEFYRLFSATPGARNPGIRSEPVIISELMYNPITRNDDDQYLELHNRTDQAIDVSGWKVGEGISYTIPTASQIQSRGYLVIAKNPAHLIASHPALNISNTVGGFSGNLSGRGERLTLTKPQPGASTSGAPATVDVVALDFTYSTGGRWPELADGGGSSMELVHPNANPRHASSWLASDETDKAPWTLIERTGVLDNGTGSADQLQVLLQGRGEALIDNVEVIPAGGANRIANSTFEAGSNGWTAEGTQSASSAENSEGHNSARSYHIRAIERGDNQVNRIRTPLTSAIPQNTVATIRARVRWLQGNPEILLRLRGNWLDAFASLDLPPNLGTPGAPNSRALSAASPAPVAVSDVQHSPVLPAANQAVTVTARVESTGPIAAATLRYRADTATSFSSTPMNDNGVNGDLVAGDGIYSGRIPGHASGAMVSFHVVGAGDRGALTSFPADAPTRQCLVRFGETRPAGTLGTYRVWMTQATLNQWNSRHKLDNTPNDVTFVYNDERVFYNVEMLYAGSPYIAPGYSGPTSGLCGYTGNFTDDDLFLGTGDLVLDWPGRDTTALSEHAAYWFADRVGLENTYRRFIRLHVNGVTETSRGSIYEDVQQPGREIVRQWNPEDPDGQFYKIERWFEFSDTGSRTADPMPTLQNFTTTDPLTGQVIKKTERYRWTWLPRSVRSSAGDYDSLFALVDAANAAGPEPYTYATEALADIEQWMGIFAIEHIVNNFDSYGHNIGKNMYAYKPENGKWQLHMFDIDWVMIASQGAGYGTSASLFDSNDPVIGRMYNHPPFRRAYFRAVKKAVEGPMAPENANAWLNARYQGLVSEGVTRAAGGNLTSPAAVITWIQARRNYLIQQLATVAADFVVTSHGGGNFTTSSNIATLTGTAPIDVKFLRINGVDYSPTWTSPTEWSLKLPLQPGSQRLVIDGIDPEGQFVADARAEFIATFEGELPSPADKVLISEIMHHPPVAGAEFVEIHNRSANEAFDLSGWSVNGLGFEFAPGTTILPGEHLVLTRNLEDFANHFPLPRIWAGNYNGQLDNGGETLSLLRPINAETSDLIDIVTYDDDPPWPAGASGTGASLQLRDANQDNARVLNWAVAQSASSPGSQPEWQYVTVSGTSSSSRLYVYLTSAGEVHIDDLRLVAGSVPGAGPNLIQNGDFETTFPGPWNVSANHSSSVITSAVRRSGTRSLRMVASAGGTTQGSSIWQDAVPLTSGAPYTLSYWYLPSTNGSGLTLRLSGNGINSSHPISPSAAPSNLATPGRPNSVSATLEGIPQIWINEFLPHNLAGETDASGEREPWIEFINAGTTPVSLNGWHLTDNFTNLARWAFPADAVIAPGQMLVVWLDGEPHESSAAQLHANFRPDPLTGSIALVAPHGPGLAVLDYVTYANASPDRSIGFFPDGQFGVRQRFPYPTPGAPNNNTALPVTVLINEWMAANTGAVVDPADNDFDDWFELHNPGASSVDLGGYQLTDSLAPTSGRWTIPLGTTIPAGGFLVVFADEETVQNGAQNGGGFLHASFKLSQNGETIALYAPNGALVDAVAFGPQSENISQGRWPDAGANFEFMLPTPGAPNRLQGSEPSAIHLAAAFANGQLALTWSSVSGATYRILATDDLTSPWRDLREFIPSAPAVITATSAFTTFQLDATSGALFFRIEGVR